MKKQLFAAIAAAIATAVAAQEPPAPPSEQMMPPPPDMTAPECPMGKIGGMPMMMPPPAGMERPDMPGVEEWKRDAAEREQRRGEIMILIQAYKIMPEEGRAAIKSELEKRIREDYLAHRKRAEQMIAKMEERIAKMKAAMSDEKTDEMVKREFDKLMKLPALPPAGMRPEMRDDKTGGQPPRMAPQNRNDRRDNAPARDGRRNQNRKGMNNQKRPPAPEAGMAPAPAEAPAPNVDGEPVPPPAPEEME